MHRHALVVIAGLLTLGPAAAHDTLEINMHHVSRYGVGEAIGTITVSRSKYGTLLTPKLHGLTPGLHGFHVHEHPDCGALEKDGAKVAGLAAGGHYDPEGTGKHLGPYADGHLGDLPPLYVGADGTATHPVLAPRLRVHDLDDRSLMIHAGGDNYSDDPKPLGGGGARMACGVVKK